jgi:hypothetical protein
MKKIILIFGLIICASILSAQVNTFTIKGTVSVKTDSLFIIDNDSLEHTTQINSLDRTIATKDYVDGKASGLDSILYSKSDYWSRIYLNGGVVDSTKIDSTYHSIYSDTANIAVYALEADTSNIALNGIDSLLYNTEYWLKAYVNNSVIDSVKIDSVYHSMRSDTALVALNTSNTPIIPIKLPYSTTVAGRILLATEGTDYPEGWTLEGDGLNLVVTHNLGRWVTNVTVWANTTGTQRQQLFNTAAHNGVTCTDDDNVTIYSLATISKPIIIYLAFE